MLPETISLYWPHDGEIDPRPLLSALAERNISLALPASPSGAQGMHFLAWRPGEPLKEGAFGILEPHADAPCVRPQLIVCPVVAFDRKCRRLGRGGGHYDRAVANLGCPAAGLAFAGQEVEQVPEELHDLPCDLILTENEVLRPDSRS